MNRLITSTAIPARELKIEALASISASFERLCLAAGLEALGEMMEADAQTACGPRHGRGKDRTAHRWGKTKGKIGFHGGKVEIARPRLRSFDGKEQALPSWEGAMTEDWLGKWAMNQMLINVSTRKFERSMRLPEGDVPAPNGSGLSKSAASRRFVALSAARLKEWMGSDLSDLGLLVIQIDGIHMDEDMSLQAQGEQRRFFYFNNDRDIPAGSPLDKISFGSNAWNEAVSERLDYHRRYRTHASD